MFGEKVGTVWRESEEYLERKWDCLEREWRVFGEKVGRE